MNALTFSLTRVSAWRSLLDIATSWPDYTPEELESKLDEAVKDGTVEKCIVRGLPLFRLTQVALPVGHGKTLDELHGSYPQVDREAFSLLLEYLVSKGSAAAKEEGGLRVYSRRELPQVMLNAREADDFQRDMQDIDPDHLAWLIDQGMQEKRLISYEQEGRTFYMSRGHAVANV